MWRLTTLGAIAFIAAVASLTALALVLGRAFAQLLSRECAARI